jgi:fumarylacetoacetate (FAA) hydrolase family protein
VLSTVGADAEIGVRSDSTWNNPEPEVALLVDSRGTAIGATLGNDVNLRDFEGRSALLLGKAKDNNASCALGPLVRVFDASFTIDDVRGATVTLRVEGEDGYELDGASNMAEISRDPLELVRQALSEHQYPTASCCSSAPCSRRCRTATTRGGGSPIKSAIPWRSPARSSGGSSTAWSPRATRPPGPRASAR